MHQEGLQGRPEHTHKQQNWQPHQQSLYIIQIQH